MNIQEVTTTGSAPQLYIKSGIKDITFYERGFGAVELRRWSDNDSNIHVAELSIDGAIFHLHEESPGSGLFDPEISIRQRIQGSEIVVRQPDWAEEAKGKFKWNEQITSTDPIIQSLGNDLNGTK